MSHFSKLTLYFKLQIDATFPPQTKWISGKNIFLLMQLIGPSCICPHHICLHSIKYIFVSWKNVIILIDVVMHAFYVSISWIRVISFPSDNSDLTHNSTNDQSTVWITGLYRYCTRKHDVQIIKSCIVFGY